MLAREVVDELNIAFGFAHRSLYLCRADCVYNDARAFKLLSKSFCKTSYAPFCHTICSKLRCAVHTRCGRDIDDASEALLLHIECGILICSPSADEVDIDNFLHLLIGEFPSIAEIDNACVGNNNVNSAECFPSLFKESLHIAVGSNVCLYCESLCAELFDMAASHPDDPEIQAHCRESANAVLHTLLELVNSVLDMSKLESDEVVLEEKPFDLTELLDEINAVLKPQAASKNIEYEIMRQDGLAVSHLIGSPRYLSQILLNLASNAIKYGRPGGYLRLNTKLISSTGQEAVYEFTCEDNGIGMSGEFQKHLFEPFSQEAQNARTKYEGVGLGLSIVKKLVDALGGTITCRSEKDVGTTFCVRLTFRIDKDYKVPDHPSEKSDHSVLEGKNVLLAEDNELNMEIAEFLLTDRGAKVTKAWNGEEAVDIFAASETGFFDIIFMDIMMPVKDGLTATREIRSLDREDAKTVPITAMSANAFSDDIQRSLDAGMNAHISKPIDEAKLTATAELLLNGRKAVLS